MSTVQFEELTQRDQYGMVVCPSVEATLYSDERLSKLSEGAIDCYRLFLDQFGSELQSFLASAMVKAQKFSKKKRGCLSDVVWRPQACDAADVQGVSGR